MSLVLKNSNILKSNSLPRLEYFLQNPLFPRHRLQSQTIQSKTPQPPKLNMLSYTDRQATFVRDLKHVILHAEYLKSIPPLMLEDVVVHRQVVKRIKNWRDSLLFIALYLKYRRIEGRIKLGKTDK